MEEHDYAELGEFINVGSGEELTIRELAAKVGKAVGFHGRISWDMTKPNGTPRKLMDESRLFALGWKPKIGLDEGIAAAYKDFLEGAGQTKGR